MDVCTIRPIFQTDRDSAALAGRIGERFEIIGLHFEEVGGDHPEPFFRVRFLSDGCEVSHINAECIFAGYDPAFDARIEDAS